MRHVLAVPKLESPFERLCDAVLKLQSSPDEGPTLAPVKDVSALAVAADGRAPGSIVAVLFAPGSDDPTASQTQFIRDVSWLRGAAPRVPLLVAVGLRALRDMPGIGGVEDAVRVLGRLGVDEVLVRPDEDSSLAVSKRLESVTLSPFVPDFLRVLASDLPLSLWLVIRRILNHVEDGVASTDRLLAESCGWDLDVLRMAFERAGGGSLRVWRERATLYGAIRQASGKGAGRCLSGREFPPPESLNLERSCRRLTGLGLDEFAAPDAWRHLLRVFATRMQAKTVGTRALDPEHTVIIPVADPGTSERFAGWVRKHRPAALGAAHRVLQCEARAEDVVQDMFVRVWEMGPERWSEFNGPYFVRAARNRALDLSKARAREAELDDPQLLSKEPGIVARLEAAEADRMLSTRYHPLPPRQAVTIWLVERGWRPRDIQRLLGLTSSSFRNLRRRARQALAETPLDTASEG